MEDDLADILPLLSRWAALQTSDREAIIEVIAAHEAQAKRRQIDYAKQHQNRDKPLVDAFKRRRIAAVLAQRILGRAE